MKTSSYVVIILMLFSLIIPAVAQDSLNVRQLCAKTSDWDYLYGLDVVNNLVYMMGNNLYILDVTDPSNPVEIGSCWIWGHNIVVEGGYAYICDPAMGMLYVTDISDPEHPTNRVQYLYNLPLDIVTDLKVSGNRAYIVGADRHDGGSDCYLCVLDISNPLNPTTIGSQIFDSLSGIAVNGDYLYMARADSGLTICSIQEPFIPLTQISTLNPMASEIADGYLYLSCRGSFCTMSLQDPLHPVVMGSCELPNAGGSQLAVSGGLVYISDNLSTGIRVVNIVDPEHPYEAGHYFPPCHTFGIAAQGNMVYSVENRNDWLDCFSIYDCLESLPVVNQRESNGLNSFALHACYPNPFNPTTQIDFNMQRAGLVSLNVYNLLGQSVATLVNGNLTQGQHSVKFDAQNLPSGMYVYRMEANGFSEQKKMMLVK
jgi:hypothetical protein